jgi:RNA polymerase primary sigma factor
MEEKMDNVTVEINNVTKNFRRVIEENPVLSREEEEKLVKEIHKHKTGKVKQEAREKLFNANIKWVIKQATSLKKNGTTTPLEDLISAGFLGLSIAIDRFDPDKFNTKFMTYATPWILLKINRLILSMGNAVYVPSQIMHDSFKYRKMANNTEDPMTDNELIEAFKTTQKKLNKIKQAFATTVSLHQKVNSHEVDEFTFADVIEDSKAKMPSQIYKEHETKEIIDKAMNQLDPLSKEILQIRYLNDSKENLSVIGKRFKITGERVRQIEVKALRKMRIKLKSKKMFDL